MLQLLLGAYAFRSSLEPTDGYRNALLSWLAVAFVLASTGYVAETAAWLSPGALPAGAAAVVLGRSATRWLLRAELKRGAITMWRAHLICVGEPAPVELFIEARAAGIDINGVSVVPADGMSRQASARACAELADQLRATFRRSPFDEIYLLLPWRKRRGLRVLTPALHCVPVSVYLFADAGVEELLQRPALRFGRFKAFQVQRAPLSWAEAALKRSMDVSIALAAIILLAPLMIAVGLAIRAVSGSPVIFSQERHGLCGNRFRIYKFRTMRVWEDGPEVKQATTNDPRVTPLGAVLRRTSIDELPQLFNVLAGDMSLVGPRPHAVAHDHYYSRRIRSYTKRQAVKPGLTGWSQVNGLRGETRDIDAMAKRVRYDIWYIENWTIWADIRILFRSAIIAFFNKNAC